MNVNHRFKNHFNNRFMNQIHISCKFNLRKASSFKPMPIYLVAYISGKQYKVATGVKVLPCQWDKSRQVAIVSNIFSEIDNYNNSVANERLSAMRDDFSNYLDYLCTHQENATDLFKHIFCKGMAKNENNTIPTSKKCLTKTALIRLAIAELYNREKCHEFNGGR